MTWYERLIPACAGNAERPRSRCLRATAHPRVRGERDFPIPRPASVRGSSPRARGTLADSPCGRAAARLIPACAGNARRGRPARAATSAHPRVRGECNDFARSKAIVLRLIPACAGNASGQPSLVGTATAHPRVRGERSSLQPSAIALAGSSPRARGTRVFRVGALLQIRLIPACAGNATITAFEVSP